MTHRRPDLEDLALLVLVARSGSIGRAAAEQGLSQPSVSRRMSALERRLQVQILDRSRRGTTLTPAGRVVVDWAVSLLGAADEFSRAVNALRSKTGRAVRVGVSMTIAEHHAPLWVGSLRVRHPEVSVELTVANSTDVAELVATGRLTVGFVETPHVPEGLACRTIGSDALVVAVPPGHPWASGGGSVPAAQLAAAELLVREQGSGTRETLEAALGARGLTLRPAWEMASNTALKAAAVAGLGPVVLSRLTLADELASGQLVAVAVPELELTRPFTAVWRHGHELPPGAAALLEAAMQGAVRPA